MGNLNLSFDALAMVIGSQIRITWPAGSRNGAGTALLHQPQVSNRAGWLGILCIIAFGIDQEDIGTARFQADTR
jgi:hypothetical protein